ncbi:MAG: MetQ/NlpA family ABC transporter substrate-binding protein [Lachnospiraceae bacterium]
MKKALLNVLTLVLLVVVSVSLTACGGNDSSAEDTNKTTDASANDTESDTENTVIKIGALPTPHGEILEQVQDVLAEQGYTLEIVTYNDYVLPNNALESGDIDANFFQHVPYLDNFNEENGTHLVSVGAVHFEPLGIYPGKTTSLDSLADGAVVAVPNDTTNEARALLLLEANGLITLKADAGLNATVLDIEENPKNLQIEELEAAQIGRSIADVDIAVINGNYAIESGFSSEDALAIEAAESEAAQTYANVVAVKEGNEENEGITALIEALTSDEIRDYINQNYGGGVVPVF